MSGGLASDFTGTNSLQQENICNVSACLNWIIFNGSGDYRTWPISITYQRIFATLRRYGDWQFPGCMLGCHRLQRSLSSVSNFGCKRSNHSFLVRRSCEQLAVVRERCNSNDIVAGLLLRACEHPKKNAKQDPTKIQSNRFIYTLTNILCVHLTMKTTQDNL